MGVRILGVTIFLTMAVPATLGVILAFALLTPGAVIALAVLGSAAGAAWHSVIGPWRSSRDPVDWWRSAALLARAPRMWITAVYGALVLLAIVGAIASLGFSIGIGLTALAAMTCVACCLVGASNLRAGHRPPAEQAPEPTTEHGEPEDQPGAAENEPAWADEIQGWSDDALCQAWRSSYVRLERCRGSGLARIAHERRAYLDELERRNPEGFAAWMASGARAPSNPSRYISTSDDNAWRAARRARDAEGPTPPPARPPDAS